MSRDNSVEISVIMSVYNTEKYLQKSLNSILTQYFESLELIVINNGSTDNSAMILAEIADNNSKMSVITLESNTGDPSKPWNIGIERSNGRYIAFIDSDDWCSPFLLAKLYQSAEEKSAEIVSCDCYEVLNNGKENLWHHDSRNQIDMILNPSLPVWGKLYRKSIFQKYGLRFYPHIHCDAEFNMIAYTYCNRIYHLNEPLYYYNRENVNSETNTLKRPRQAEVVTTFRTVLEKSSQYFSDEIMYAVAVQTYHFLGEQYCFFSDVMLNFLNEFSKKILNNRYFSENYNGMGFIAELAKRKPLPKLICTVGQPKGQEWLSEYEIRQYNDCDATCETIVQAKKAEDKSVVLTYGLLKSLYEHGGILMSDGITIMAPLGELLSYDFCVGKKDNGISSRIISAAPHNEIVEELICRYLALHQKLKKSDAYYNYRELDLLLESILQEKYRIVYDLSDCIDGNVCLFSSARLYYGIGAKSLAKVSDELPTDYVSRAVDELLQIVDDNKKLNANVQRYENSTCWKITKPLRTAAEKLKRIKRKG